MKKTSLFTVLFTLLFCSAAFSQGNPALQNIITKLKTFSSNHIVEKAYLDFDKPYYAAGDTMYFKAYMTVGDRHEVSKVGGILHVDLINPSNVIIRNLMLRTANGIAAGDFSLPDTLQSGPYRVRAYTRYMQNAPEYFFDKTIIISSGMRGAAAAIDTRQTANPDIQFFPEGGEMVAAILSKVAFKAVGTNGLGIKAKGVIVDNNNLQVAAFTSNDLGMGSFFIQPEDGKTYKAKVTFANGMQNTTALPVPKAKGIVLHVRDTSGKVAIEIVCNKGYLQDNLNKEVNLVIYSNGLLSQVTTKLDNKEMGMDLPKAQFPSGVMQVTLFSQEGEPLSERLIFLKNADMLNITVNSDKQTYKRRDRVAVNVNAKSKDLGVQGFFSAAVIDESKVPYDDNSETTILSYLLLTSELKGYIEKPNYYFAHNAKDVRNDLDALMLTQGYRKFSWKQLISNDTTHFTFAPEKALSITGIEKNAAGVPMANKDVMLVSVKNGGMLGEKTDKSGVFKFDNIDFDEGTQFTLQATGSTKDKSSTVISLLKGNVEPPVVENSALNIYSAQSMSAFAGKAGGTNAIIQNTGIADQELTGSDLGNAPSLTAALKGRLNGVNFVSGIPYLNGNKYPVLIVVDGKIRGSLVKLDNINTQNVSTIQLLNGKNADAYGINGSSGVLVINTKAGTSGTDLNASNEYKYEAQNIVKVKNTDFKRIDDAHYRSSNLSGPGHADQVVHGDAFKNATSLLTALNGVLHGVDFVNGVPVLRGNSVVTSGGSGGEAMYVVIDGVGGGTLDNINPHAVETVEVLKGANASIYGVAGGAGVIVVTTRMEADSPDITTSNLGSLKFKAHGFYKAREFYSPKYTVGSSADNTPDVRSTLYWNPNLTTDKDGNAAFEFYNADGKGSHRVIVEGMDTNGNIGWQVYRYNVE